MVKKLIIINVFFFILAIKAFSQVNSIFGLELWLTGDSVHHSNSSDIDTIYDLSALKNHAYQLNILNRPQTYQTSLLNNHKVIYFDAVDDYLTLPQIDFRTIFIIAKTNESPNTDYRGLLGGLISSTNIGGYLLNCVSGSEQIALGLGFSDFSSINKNSLTTSPIGNFSPIDNYWLGSFVYNLNRSQIAEIGRIDAGNSPGRYWKGEIAEIIVFNRVLNITETNQVENYLYDKYAPPIQLPNDISVLNSFCDTSLIPIVINNNQYSNFHWSTSATTPTISVNKSGKYWVKATNIFGKESSDTILVNYPKYEFKDSTFCPGNTIQWNTNLSINQFSFLWQDGLSNDSVFNISSAGDYHVKITDNFGCFIESDTITATIDNFKTIASLGLDTNLCSGNAVYLKQGLSSNLSYTWNTGSNNDSLYITSSGQYSAIITNSNNCVAKDTINVTVIGQAPTAAFLNSVACKNNVVTFTDNSSPPSGNTITSWFWNYGDGTTLADTSHLQNSFYTYADTGNYTINLSVSTDVGCKQNLIKNIHVAPKPTVNYNNIIACKNDSALFSNLSSSLNYTPLTYSWHFGDPSSGSANSSALANPKHLFSQQSTYSVKLITTNKAGCSDSITKNINVKAQVTANFTNNSPCTNAPIIFQDNSIEPAPINPNSHFWTIGTSTLTGLTATKSFTIPGVYPVALTVNGSNGCISSITKQIDVKLPPFAELSLNTICLNDTSKPLNLSVPQNGPITSWNWQSNTITFSTSQTASLVPTTPGNYNIKLVVTSSDNCKDSMTKQLTVLPLPNVDFVTNPNSFYYINSPITFSPTIITGSLYNWTIDGSLYATPVTSVSFNTVGTHTASLYMKDAFGCANKKTKSFNVYGYFSDLAVIDIRSQKSNDNFISVEADLANFGTSLISNFEISYQITDAGTVKEIWNGTLNPSAFMTYQFNSKAFQKNNSDDFITCINIETVNSIQDDNLSNNNLCIAANVNNVTVNDPSPNPTDGDINLSVVLPKNNAIIISLVDALGQVVYPEYTINGSAGLNLLSIPTTGLNRGSYVLKITIGDKIFNKKILKTIHD